MTKQAEAERTEAIERLRGWIKPGDTVYTIMRHVSKSGMMRVISCVGFDQGRRGIEPCDYSFNVAKAVGEPMDRDRGGVKVSGCGMDMGFHIVYSLSARMFPDGFGCVGESCPSNDHSNGDRDRTPHGEVGGCTLKREPCTCHDPSAWRDPESYPNGCSGCGCHRVSHWHRDGGYALRQRWL